MSIKPTPKKDPVPQEVALRIHIEAIIENLVAFHSMTRQQAENGVAPLDLMNKPIILQSDPYLLAWELIHGLKPPGPQKYKQDRSIARVIMEAASRKFMHQR